MIFERERGKDDAKIDKSEASKQRRWNSEFCGKEILPYRTTRRYAHGDRFCVGICISLHESRKN